ncbi:hypothetical protein RclHR1_01410029 [Rhizophagus clarus]|uniref:F-box domain-containing protein n=1 Tax=Rhizophagus clarus TaxID=94130 RepID=A0A2Z6R4E2_9GLOM|nr:hypothetical protein RclHR1_01410029 [Rhizophagus clarus]GES75114.1 hypothetical protein GLOIN_2v1686505 [Rhizophagus clarus]
MSKLYRDILYLIFEELQYDKVTLVSCLMVNKIWCEIAVSILWKNPWEDLTHEGEILLLNVIVSHLLSPDNTRINNTNSFFSFFTNSYKKPLFNYVRFCKHLNLETIEDIFYTHAQYKDLRNDILSLFINENAEYTHLYMREYYDYHHFPGAEQCFSKIKFLRCDATVNDNNLAILTKMCKSIKELEFFIYKRDNNYGISRLIENQESLNSISFLNRYSPNDGLFRKTLENSLIKHANTIHHFYICGQLETQVLESFVNLKTLKLKGEWHDFYKWNYVENLSLPSLQILHAININNESLISLIKNSGGNLIEISITYSVPYSISYPDIDIIREIIQAIYQSCPNLTYLELPYKNGNVLNLEELLIMCQNLKVLGICYHTEYEFMDWDSLFSMLATSSPISLRKFIFIFPVNRPELESLKLFFDNWEGRHSMSLIINIEGDYNQNEQLNDLLGKYKEKGVIKEFIRYTYNDDDLIESKAKEFIKDLKDKTAKIFDKFKKMFNYSN